MNDFDKYVIARWLYSIGVEFIPDYEWQLLHEKFLRSPSIKERIFARKSWSKDICPTDLLKKYNLDNYIKEVVVSTDKSESITSINTLAAADSICNNWNGTDLLLSVKADGWNMQIDYYNGKLLQARTRGRSSDAVAAENIVPHLPQNINISGKVRIYGECVCPDRLFTTLKQEKGVVSQRNCVSTALADSIYSGGLRVKAFDIEAPDITFSNQEDKLKVLKDNGFQTVDYVISNGAHMLNLKQFAHIRYTLDYATDGCVVRPLALPSQEKYAFRIYEWAEPYYKSYVQGYQPSYAPLWVGYQLGIYPIKTDIGSTQRFLDIDNLQRILENKLEPGAPVAFVMRSHAIADIDVTVTRYLQEEFEGKYNVYRELVEKEESLK